MVKGERHTDPCKPSASWITISQTQAETIIANFLAVDRTPTLEITTKAKEWLEDLVEWHLLQIASKPTHIEFHHQLFQEYYAAEWLAPQLEKFNDEELQYYYLNYLKWTESLAMSMSFVESEVLAVRMVKLALEVDLSLGARLAGEATLSLQNATLNVLLQKGFQPSPKILGNAEVLSRLRQLAETITVVEIPLEMIAAIQSRCGFYNYEIYQQAQEAKNLGFEDDLIRNLYKDIDKVISQIQENPELRQEDNEDRLTIDIVNQLRILEYNVSHETKIGGHADIVIRKNDFLWLGEAKIYRDNNNYLWEGFLQLTTRYSIGDYNQENGGLLIYIRQEDASSIMKNWQNYLLEKSLPDYSFRLCKMRSLAFISTHKHEKSGLLFHVRHIPVMLHFAPKDKSGRRKTKSP